MDKIEIQPDWIIIACILCGCVVLTYFFPLVSESDQARYDTLESPDQITIVYGSNTLSPQRIALQNVTYYKHSVYPDPYNGFDIKYINETGKILDINIRHDYSIEIENGHLIIYL